MSTVVFAKRQKPGSIASAAAWSVPEQLAPAGHGRQAVLLFVRAFGGKLVLAYESASQ
jgi:hypothetical protein